MICSKIKDYILPIEIAKFFFFDAEKIVSFAQINTPEQRAELSKAYSQVLGIQKYDELKKELEKLQDDYRRDSAQPKDKAELNDLIATIENGNLFIEESLQIISEDDEQLAVLQYELNELQEKLIREGDLMSVEKLNELREKQERFRNDMSQAEEGLKEIYNYIPFGLAGNVVSLVINQLKDEKAFKQNKLQLEGVEEKTDEILNDLDKARMNYNGFIDIKIRSFYEEEIRKLILKHFYNDYDTEKFNDFQVLHDFTDIQYDGLIELVARLKESKSLFEEMSNRYSKAKAELFSIERKIHEAEKNAEGDYIQSLRKKKNDKDNDIKDLQQDIARLNYEIEQKKEEIKAAKQQKENLSKKIEVSDKNKKVDDQAARLIHTIQRFLLRFKDEKKKALEKRLQEKLTSFLHKKDLVHEVVVDIQGNGEDVDINLYDSNKKKIDKGILSMGERQMFASALLGALVEETQIEFPVFIDSPMQKFDVDHSQNILTKFYPSVSKQVILFPLLMKELTEKEYLLIDSHVNKTYLIENTSKGSHFIEVPPKELFDYFKKS